MKLLPTMETHQNINDLNDLSVSSVANLSSDILVEDSSITFVFWVVDDLSLA
jgi:hypothetical protein